MCHQLHRDSGTIGAEPDVRVGDTREHHSLLAGPEKRALIWLALSLWARRRHRRAGTEEVATSP